MIRLCMPERGWYRAATTPARTCPAWIACRRDSRSRGAPDGAHRRGTVRCVGWLERGAAAAGAVGCRAPLALRALGERRRKVARACPVSPMSVGGRAAALSRALSRPVPPTAAWPSRARTIAACWRETGSYASATQNMSSRCQCAQVSSTAALRGWENSHSAVPSQYSLHAFTTCSTLPRVAMW